MARQTIIWTALPNGRNEPTGRNRGSRRVSVVVSPRLSPEDEHEQRLDAFREWLDWPATLARLTFGLEVEGTVVGLVPVADPDLRPDSALWRHLFEPTLAVAGYVFKDMSALNLRSYSVRNVLGFVRQHYANLAATAGRAHPRLLPWRSANPALQGMLGEAGTRVRPYAFADRRLEYLAPGFGRFHDADADDRHSPSHEAEVNRRVFSDQSCIKAPVRLPGARQRLGTFALRALPPDWEDPEQQRGDAGSTGTDDDRKERAALMGLFSTPAEYALWQADRFYRRSVPTTAQRRQRRPDFSGGARVTAPEFDFHQRVASYGDHPQLLRRLGLVIDCVLEDDRPIDALLAEASPANGFMRLRVKSDPPHDPSGDACPATAWWATERRFVTRPYTGDHAAGLLKMERANDRLEPVDPARGSLFDVFQVDPDGAALKTVDFVLSAQRLVGKNLAPGADGKVTYTTGDDQPVAALRSGGLGVSRHGRAGNVATIAAGARRNNEQIEAGGPAAHDVALFTEDVLRGYRIDVKDLDAGRWRSLCQRVVQCTALPSGGAPAIGVPMAPDEGYVKGASTTARPDQPDDHYLHETLFRWTGWSLAAPRPGRAIKDRTEPGSQLQTEEVTTVQDTASGGNGISVQVAAAKGSLPRLRFGHRYQLRARIVDLAGNSLALGDRDLGDQEQASEPVTYGRFEPVDPPALVLTAKLSEGESLERMVIRSNFDRDTSGYAADIAGGVPLAGLYANPDFEYSATSERHVVPPKSSVQQCELHGAFDFATGKPDARVVKDAYAIAARESGSLMQPAPGADIELVTPTALARVATNPPGELIKPPAEADATRDRFAPGQYLIHREPLVPVPYLPDPAAGGVALHGVPGIEQLVTGVPLQLLAPGLAGIVLGDGLRAAWLPDTRSWVLLVDFDRDPGDDPATDWPDDLRALRIVLAEQPGELAAEPCEAEAVQAAAPSWSLAERRLTIFLPKGHIAHLLYASFAHDRLIGHFGLPDWLDTANAAKLRAEAMAGANWMMTPWRALTLVHATQQPVCEPRLAYAHVERHPGDSFATLDARRTLLHGPSTGKFEIIGEWDEWIDDPLADDAAIPGPRRVHHEAQLAEVRLSDNHANLFPLGQAVIEQRALEPAGGQIDGATMAKRASVPGNRHEFGDTRFRFVRYRLRATTRFREYLPEKLFANAALIARDGPAVEEHHVEVRTRPGADVAHDAGAPVLRVDAGGAGGLVVPSSAPPAAPELVYSVPTFRWDRSTPGGNEWQSTRVGNGLRVYLERPWFSSGDGELLGVVIAGDGTEFSGIEAGLTPFVTQWGMDPIWDSGVASTRARTRDFPAAVTSETAPLLETGTAVGIVGHRVDFDSSRKLWYCDVELDPGRAYMPFVRLALVRFQPNALDGAKISTVVLAEFAQVLPRRAAYLERDGATLRMRVHGPAPTRGPMRQFNDDGGGESPFLNVSHQPIPGAEGETGTNRFELVLQTRDPGIDSDLAWADHTVIGSGLVGEVTDATPKPGPVRPQPIDPKIVTRSVDPRATVRVRTRKGLTLRFDRTVELTAATRAIGVPDVIGKGSRIPQLPPFLIDPVIWTLSTTLPKLPGDRPARLMLREFERFYTDRTTPASPLLRNAPIRIVVEERLVYAELFDLR